jgi:hypothetical protein
MQQPGQRHGLMVHPCSYYASQQACAADLLTVDLAPWPLPQWPMSSSTKPPPRLLPWRSSTELPSTMAAAPKSRSC